MDAPARTVLFVDDDPDMLAAVEHFLGARGWRVVTSQTPFGFGGLLRAHQPDVVVLDVGIPALDGRALAWLLSKQPGGGTTPVVFFSSLDDDELERLARQFAGASFVSKRSGLESLSALLREVVPGVPGGPAPPPRVQ